MNKIKFDSQEFYHIYNHSIGHELLFRHKNDYDQFLIKMERYLTPFCQIISYCLLPNHFHLLIKILELDNENNSIEQTLKNFFNSYTRSYNSIHNRVGRLFRHGYKSKIINSDEYLKWLIYYIHRNPVHHGLSKNLTDWEYSSYKSILSNQESNTSHFIFDLFGDEKEFKTFSEILTRNYKEENDFLKQIEFK